jgi:hypothetical protein
MNGPAFLVIGSARSGTTYLSRALAHHPRLAITDPKEPNFLALGVEGHTFAGPGDHLIGNSVIRDEGAWRRLFASGGERCTGEASVTTMYYPEITIPRIERFCPGVPLVAVLRAPWDRARSAWMLLAGQGREMLSFSDALADEERRIAAGYESMWHYRSQSTYARQIRPFIDTFGERLLVIEYERMVAGTSEVELVFDHLGFEPVPVPDLGRVNAASDPRRVWLRRRMAVAHARPALRRAMRVMTPARARRALLDALSADTTGEPFPSGFIESFDDDLADLGSILGDRAPTWTMAR